MQLSTRQMILALLAMFGVAPLLHAQYVRIGNTGAIPPAGMTAPTVLKSAIALYTEDARIHGIEGTVTIEALIGEDGKIRRTRLLKGLGFGLDEVALTSVQEWTLSPATRNGLPVSVGAQMDVAFSLRSANAVHMGPGMLPPAVQQRVEPQYTDEARRSRLSGTVVLQAVVRSDGTVDVLRVVRGLPLGLTDSAIQAIKQWQFRPGQNKDGQNADIALNIEVNFNIEKRNRQ
jgi:TonB family protein